MTCHWSYQKYFFVWVVAVAVYSVNFFVGLGVGCTRFWVGVLCVGCYSAVRVRVSSFLLILHLRLCVLDGVLSCLIDGLGMQ